ncbi:MAG TPA: chemotaxis response regulator protein-glutamate methylesterase [Lachnospiraceae bacterium]|nr:chemotaxis response regulator protein-glutamate methylesterase [Lachnospiraceae bacterium]
MKKKILIIDDSALMRRVLCDIINSDDRFEVVDMAKDGAEGFKLLTAHKYDGVVLDVYMPKMTGLDMLREMQKSKVYANVLMASTTTGEGARETIEALDLGAVDFIKKPENVANARHADFKTHFLNTLYAVTQARSSHMQTAGRYTSGRASTFTQRFDVNIHTRQSGADRLSAQSTSAVKMATEARKHLSDITDGKVGKREDVSRLVHDIPSRMGKKIVAIASSTGGPRALQAVIPKLPKNLKAPVLLVQHMPKGFTKSLAERLSSLGEIPVTEAVDGEVLKVGHVYIAQGGLHMNADHKGGDTYVIRYSDEPTREGVKPCANYMYESLATSRFDEIVCVVLTGMGSDGTAGILNLKKKKNVRVIAQDEETSTVYGMPKSVALAGVVNEVVPLDSIADHIIKNVGVY